jgi:hypothetical protein
MDGRLVTELMLDNFKFVPKTVFFHFPFVVLLCVTKNSYIHSFMPRLDIEVYSFFKKM